MAQRINKLYRSISMKLIELATIDVLCMEFDDMLKKIPNAQYVEIVLVEHYDDGKPE